jgi:hypothetical protein
VIPTLQNSLITLQRFFQIASVLIPIGIFEKESLQKNKAISKGYLFFLKGMGDCRPTALERLQGCLKSISPLPVAK